MSWTLTSACEQLLLGLQLAMCPTIVVVSKIVERTGHMWPSMPIGSALMAIGCGLFYTFSPSTSIAKVIGYQILAGIGIGATLNVMTVIVQADYATRPIIEPHATNLLNWFGFVGRIVGITIATNIFENKVS
jgi:MFS family permease